LKEGNEVGKFSHCHLPSTGEAAERNFALFERSEFAKFRQFRGAQGRPQDQVARVPFLLVPFLWASKEKEYRKGEE
jgi:hypothetical protein